jgi:hypothetical protein
MCVEVDPQVGAAALQRIVIPGHRRGCLCLAPGRAVDPHVAFSERTSKFVYKTAPSC